MSGLCDLHLEWVGQARCAIELVAVTILAEQVCAILLVETWAATKPKPKEQMG